MHICVYTHVHTQIFKIPERVFKIPGNSVISGQGNWMTGVCRQGYLLRVKLHFVLNPIHYFLSSLLLKEFNSFIYML